MKNVMMLRRRGLLTEQQVLTAVRFKKNPNDFKLAPTLFRICFDLIVRDVPLEQVEKQRGWAARSAKVLLSQMLYALEEVQGIWWGDDLPEEAHDKDDTIRFLTGDDDQEISKLIVAYGFTGLEARMFLILTRDKDRVLSKETILRRLYHRHNDNDNDFPETNIVDVWVCKLRKKMPSEWTIKTVWGEGYCMVQTQKQGVSDAGLAGQPDSANHTTPKPKRMTNETR